MGALHVLGAAHPTSLLRDRGLCECLGDCPASLAIIAMRVDTVELNVCAVEAIVVPA